MNQNQNLKNHPRCTSEARLCILHTVRSGTICQSYLSTSRGKRLLNISSFGQTSRTGRESRSSTAGNILEKEAQLQSTGITKLSCSPLSLCFNPHSKPASLPPDKSKQELSFRPSIQTATAAVLRSIRSRRKRKEKELEIEKSVVVDVVAYAKGKLLGICRANMRRGYFCCAVPCRKIEKGMHV